MCGIDQGKTQQHPFWPTTSGWRHSDTERGIGRDQTLNVEGGVGGEYQVINRREKMSREMLERIESVGPGQRSGARARPGKSGKSTVTLSKAVLIGGGGSRAVELTRIGRSDFCDWQNFRYIVTVAATQLSIFSQVFKM
jgi:hypothetical protein